MNTNSIEYTGSFIGCLCFMLIFFLIYYIGWLIIHWALLVFGFDLTFIQYIAATIIASVVGSFFKG